MVMMMRRLTLIQGKDRDEGADVDENEHGDRDDENHKIVTS